jgi:cytochrome c oxidase subunit 4
MTNRPGAGVFFAVWAALMLLLVLTFALGEINFGRWNFPIAVSIAAGKATLIVLFFMEVRYSSGLIRLMACVGFLWLSILLGLTFADYATRAWTSFSSVIN